MSNPRSVHLAPVNYTLRTISIYKEFLYFRLQVFAVLAVGTVVSSSWRGRMKKLVLVIKMTMTKMKVSGHVALDYTLIMIK